MKPIMTKVFILLVSVQMITSFLLMDINGPFFLVREKQYYNPTDIFVILTWKKQGLKLLAFAINFPMLLVLNTLTMKLFLWIDKQTLVINEFFSGVISVLFVYICITLIWLLFLQQSDFWGRFLHPLAVLVGIGFFVSNIFVFFLWYLYLLLKKQKQTEKR